MPRCSVVPVVPVLLLPLPTVALPDAPMARVALSLSSLASLASFAWRSSPPMPRCSVVPVLLLPLPAVAVRDAPVARVALLLSSMASFASSFGAAARHRCLDARWCRCCCCRCHRRRSRCAGGACGSVARFVAWRSRTPPMPRCSVWLMLLLLSPTVAVRNAPVARVALQPAHHGHRVAARPPRSQLWGRARFGSSRPSPSEPAA